MTPATNTIDSSPSLPTLAAIQRRRRELLAFQSWQRPAQAAEESCLEEDACLDQEPEEPDYAEDPEPPPAPAGPPTLAAPALYGLAGLAVWGIIAMVVATREVTNSSAAL